MKTYKHLYPQVYDIGNLYHASQLASLGKKKKPNVVAFHQDLMSNLRLLAYELESKTYQAGAYQHFYIYEPKKRLISAAPYRDRVVHHALCNIIQPLFERSFIYDSYANRVGKGTHKAILRYQYYCRSYKYVLKCDIAKFFPSIHHEVLKGLLSKKLACPDTLWLTSHIIDNFDEPIGLPIGNLTSQFWANVYMNPLDHFAKDVLRLPYLRYVDDFAIFANDKDYLHEVQAKISTFLEPYHLGLHPIKTRIYQCKEGVSFLGHRVFPTFRLLKKDNLKRFKRRLKKQLHKVSAGTLNEERFRNSVQSWVAHANFSNTYRLRAKLLGNIPYLCNKVSSS